MTRKELVEALTANFAPDEDVYFVYMDEDYGKCLEKRVEIKEHTEVKRNGHWEMKDTISGEWKKVAVEDIKPKRGIRWMPEGGVTKVTRKVLCIGDDVP